MDLYEHRIANIIDKFSCTLFKDPNVICFGLGQKEINNHTLNIPCLKIFVEKKIAMNNLNFYKRIPSTIGGVLTDIFEFGPIVKKKNKETPLLKPNSKLTLPAVGGSSCIHKNKVDPNSLGGSIAHLVYNPDRKTYHILSCNSVLTKDNTFRADEMSIANDKILYPGATLLYKNFYPGKNFTNGKPVEIAKGLDVAPINPGFIKNGDEMNSLNAGLAWVDNLNLVNSGHKTSKNHLKKIITIEELKIGEDELYTYTTIEGETKGKLTLSKACCSVDFYDNTKCFFKEQLVIQMPYNSFNQGTLGLKVSNALIHKNPSVWGMCIGGHNSSKGSLNDVVYFTPIKQVLDYFKVEIVDLIDNARPKK